MIRSSLLTLSLFFGLHLVSWASEPGQNERIGVPVSYQLPTDEPLPRTYLVTLAITDSENPDWIVSTFVAGVPRTVTEENGGRFSEVWDGLDENHMPVPPGEYGVKGIYTPAHQWKLDGEWHAITPEFVGGVSSWQPPREKGHLGLPFSGDPVNTPLTDVAVGPNGVAVFYHRYLENGLNAPLIDLNKPVGYEQFIRAFPSGGAGGGTSVATDGETVWAFSTDGGPRFVYRADGESFGSSPGANRRNAYIPDGWVTAMAAVRDEESGESRVYVAQGGRIEAVEGRGHRPRYMESETDFVDEITVHDGEGGEVLSRIGIPRPRGLALYDGRLYALHGEGDGWAVSSVELDNGVPVGEWKQVFSVPAQTTPFDLAIDRSGRIYLSDSGANKVIQFDGSGKVTRTYGRLPVQKPGTYDPETLMEPQKLATWRDEDGKDRLLIVEAAGPNRVSEWSGETGELLREFATYQTKSNNGYAFDPEDASHVYLPGHNDWLTRFKVDYESGEWKVDAVWPNVEAHQRRGLDKPVAIRINGQFFLASEQNFTIYRMDGDHWVRSAGIVEKDGKRYFWNDANGNGRVDEEELYPAELPGSVLTFHGQRWLQDLSYVAPAQNGRDIWRVAPEGFDEPGNPIFRNWEKLATDPIFQARAEGSGSAIYGGNELAAAFTSDWMQVDAEDIQDGFFVQARSGPNFTANYGSQHKISRYDAKEEGGYELKWRVGRTALQWSPERGELQGGMRIFRPINGLLTVVDQTRSGILLYTEDGLYVDTVFAPGRLREAGVYAQPGEFFAGTMFANEENGGIYYAAGKYTPLLFRMVGWSLKENPVQRLTNLPEQVTIQAAQIASPPEIALALRGGAGQTSLARFVPALGGAEMDGSLTGWESAEPVVFQSGDAKTVEVRGLYEPETLYLRWHVRLGEAFEPKALPPLERIFTHDQRTDTVGFYIQGDVNAGSGGSADGRPGDVRFVFGLFEQDGALQPVAVGMYPEIDSPAAEPQVYRTPVGEVSFAHVGEVEGIELGYSLDEDGEGFVIAAAIPRKAIPALEIPFGDELRTMANFDANLGGHDKFWWANADGSANLETYDEASEARLYPGSWAPVVFAGLEEGVPIRYWKLLGPFGGPEAKDFVSDPRPGMKEEVQSFFEDAVFPPDEEPVDMDAVFSGPMVQGYWPDPGEISWEAASIEDLDTRVRLGSGSQVWYGATWVYAPEEMTLEFLFQGHPQTPTRWFLNDELIEIPLRDYEPTNERNQRRVASREAQLRKGWNQILFRAYAFGYPPARAGLVLNGDEDQLWSLRFSGQSPEE